MKTPRELLLERHRAAEPKLDALRRSVLATVRSAQPPAKSGSRMSVRAALRELLWSCRWHLAGLSAVCVVVLVLNADSSSASTTARVREKFPARQLLASLQVYRRQLLELLDWSAAEPAAPPPRRSERHSPLEVV